ncbi:hypothetical protein ACRAWC_01760 [Leifsonia sp. L25]|uniref:hypothetical protein n=1 Tax=Actinomycetes TaxID=1760 RepID=UPI003D69BC4C
MTEINTLPGFVTGTSLLPDAYAPGEWATIPQGIDADGDILHHDIRTQPHRLFLGYLGSAAEPALISDLVHRLARGHRIVLIDPKNRLRDVTAKPWYTDAVTDGAFDAVAEGTYAAVEELPRRADVLKAHKAATWSDLPEEVRDQESLVPITVVVADLGALTLTDGYSTVERLAALRAVHNLTEISATGRAVGIYLLIRTQRATADTLPPVLRENLNISAPVTPIQKPLAWEDLATTFGSEARQVAALLNAGDKHPGRAVTIDPAGRVVLYRVNWFERDEVDTHLSRLGVPKAS